VSRNPEEVQRLKRGPFFVLKDTKTYTHLKPGQKGTKRLVEQYGDKLLCVRYRYDEIRHIKMKTVEIIVDEKPCKPPLRYRDEDMVAVMVPFSDKDLRDRLKAVHGRWDPEERLWRVLFGSIKGDIELTERILKE
jgi:hypothetical protein